MSLCTRVVTAWVDVGRRSSRKRQREFSADQRRQREQRIRWAPWTASSRPSGCPVWRPTPRIRRRTPPSVPVPGSTWRRPVAHRWNYAGPEELTAPLAAARECTDQGAGRVVQRLMMVTVEVTTEVDHRPRCLERVDLIPESRAGRLLDTTHHCKGKVKWIYIAPSRETSKSLRHGSHSVTCNYTNACLYLVSRKRSPDGASPDWCCDRNI